MIHNIPLPAGIKNIQNEILSNNHKYAELHFSGHLKNTSTKTTFLL
jgi:hypothetical protein